MLVSVKARSIGMVMRNAWAGGREHFLSVLGHFDDFTFENVHVSKTLLRLRPVLARRNHIPHVSLPPLLSIPTVPLQFTLVHTRVTHPEIAFNLLGKSHRKFRHGNTPRKPTRMAIRFVFGSANNLYKWRREWTTCKTVNGSVNTSTNDRVTPVKVPKCGGLELV